MTTRANNNNNNNYYYYYNNSHPILTLRGGAMATDGDGYNPNFVRRVKLGDGVNPPRRQRRNRSHSRSRSPPAPHRTRSQSRRRQQKQKGGGGGGKESGPSVPPGGAYEAVAKDRNYDRRLEKLGIGDSLLRPAAAAAAAAPPGDGSGGGGGGGGGGDGDGGIGGIGLAWIRQVLGWQDRGLGELTSGEWRPTRARFEMRWPEGDDDRGELHSEWYEMVYTHLYVRTAEFVHRYFGHGDIRQREGIWTGGGGFSRQFRWYVEQVARQDNAAGGWDQLLAMRLHREYLVTGVIGKVLEREVFEELLFGADETQRKMLEAHDEATIQQEGYQRTDLRSSCVRAALNDETLTPDFWPSVDRLSLQLTTLLLPLLRLMDRHFLASRGHSLRSFYQDLHGIVAEAGYLSIGIRWSRNIFRFSSPFLGQAWDLDQQHVDDAIYNASKHATDRADRRAEQEWRAKRDHQAQAQAQQSGGGPAPTAGERAREYFAAAVDNLNILWNRVTTGQGKETGEQQAGDAGWRPPSRLAKVQIVVWPMLQRFATATKIYPDEGYADGENITTLLRSQVVYYSGRTDQPAEQSEDVPTLEEWVLDRQQHREWWVRWVVGFSVAWTLFNLFLILYWSTRFKGDMAMAIQVMLEPAKNLRRELQDMVQEVREIQGSTVRFSLRVARSVASGVKLMIKQWLWLVFQMASGNPLQPPPAPAAPGGFGRFFGRIPGWNSAAQPAAQPTPGSVWGTVKGRFWRW